MACKFIFDNYLFIRLDISRWFEVEVETFTSYSFGCSIISNGGYSGQNCLFLLQPKYPEVLIFALFSRCFRGRKIHCIRKMWSNSKKIAKHIKMTIYIGEVLQRSRISTFWTRPSVLWIAPSVCLCRSVRTTVYPQGMGKSIRHVCLSQTFFNFSQQICHQKFWILSKQISWLLHLEYIKFKKVAKPDFQNF